MKTPYAIAVATLCLWLGGCESGEGTWEAEAKCSGLPSKPSCEIGGKIKGTWSGKKISSLAQHALFAANVADAAQFALDVSGSTIAYPTAGSATLMLKNSDTGLIRATREFRWTRNGSLLKLLDPDAVNTWAINSGGDANELQYRITPFAMNSGYGQQLIAVKSIYEGTVTATSTSSYYRCSPYPSPHQCRQ